MLYRREGYPEESEIVLCTVTKVQHNTVFVNLDEYGKSGIIHISEISPGRIRNIRDYVKEGKKVVCKILRINMERGHIDLSLRRVTESQKREKNNITKQEQKAEKIVEFAAQELKKPVKEIYDKVSDKVFEHYDYLNSCFEDTVAENFTIDQLGLEKGLSDVLLKLILQRIKLPEVHIKGDLIISSYAPDGVEIIKEALKKGEAENTTLSYGGAGKYRIVVKAETYPEAESMIKKSTEAVISHVENKEGEASFKRIDDKS